MSVPLPTLFSTWAIFPLLILLLSVCFCVFSNRLQPWVQLYADVCEFFQPGSHQIWSWSLGLAPSSPYSVLTIKQLIGSPLIPVSRAYLTGFLNKGYQGEFSNRDKRTVEMAQRITACTAYEGTWIQDLGHSESPPTSASWPLWTLAVMCTHTFNFFNL